MDMPNTTQPTKRNINNLIWTAGILIVIVVAFWAWQRFSAPVAETTNNTNQSQATGDNTPANQTAEQPQQQEIVTVSAQIVYDGISFVPASVTIQKGQVVTFKNESSAQFWPASAMHPTHTVYPGSGIQKCADSALRPTLFDACEGLAAGSSWSFTFNELGAWSYHDHLNPNVFGKVIVEQ